MSSKVSALVNVNPGFMMHMLVFMRKQKLLFYIQAFIVAYLFVSLSCLTFFSSKKMSAIYLLDLNLFSLEQYQRFELRLLSTRAVIQRTRTHISLKTTSPCCCNQGRVVKECSNSYDFNDFYFG